MDQSSPLRFPANMLHRLRKLVQQSHLILKPALTALFSPDRALNAERGTQSVASDQRRHPRITLRNTKVYVTDGCLFASAVLENISPAGVCLCNLPEQLYKNAGNLTVFSSDNPGLPILQIEPRWQKNGWRGKTIGGIILNASDAWRLFFVHTAGQFSL